MDRSQFKKLLVLVVPVIVIGLVFSSFSGTEAVVIQISNQDTSTGSSSDDTTIDFTIEVNEPSTVDFPNGVDSETLPSNLIIRIIVDPDTINEIVALYDINGNSLDDTDPQIISNIIFNGIESSSSNDGALGYGNFYGYSYGFGQLGDGTNVYGLTSTGFGEDKIGLYTINLDTVLLSDGQHGLRIDVLDKSDDTEFFSSGAITITNVDIAPDTAPTPLISTTTSPTFLELIPFTVNFGEEIKIIQLAAAMSHTSDTDSTIPIPVINTTAADPTNLEPIPFTVNFGENMTSGEFVAAEITLSSGTVTDFTPDSANQLFAFNATDAADNANLTVDVAANVATDLAGNNNTAADQLSIAVDRTAPTLSAVAILSSNTNTALAADNDEVTLSFTASEIIKTPAVTIDSTVVTPTNPSGNNWEATITAEDGTTTEGTALQFTISFEDQAGNDGATRTDTEDDDGNTVTADFTAPTLSAVAISSNNDNSTLAADNDEVTLSFTASEIIKTPAVTIDSTVVTPTNPSGNNWEATITAEDGTTTEGTALQFTISFEDQAGNDGATRTDTEDDDGNTVTADFTAPTLSAVAILSSNTNTALAADNDEVTLSFTASEIIKTPAVTIDSTVVTPTNPSGNNWEATITAEDGTTTEGTALQFTISFEDQAGNDGATRTDTEDDDGNTVTADFTAPTLSAVAISSNNDNSTLAADNDEVTLSFTASEIIKTPAVTIDSTVVTPTNPSGNNWEATITAEDGTTTEGTALQFTISFEDQAGNDGATRTDTEDDDGNTVTADFTAPTLSAVAILSSNTNTALAADNDEVTLSFTASEIIKTPAVTIDSTVVTPTNPSGNNWEATITAEDGTTTEGTALQFTISFEDQEGNDGATRTDTEDDDGNTVTADFTAPTLSAVAISSNNDNSTLAADNDEVTLSFTASEIIKTPAVTIDSTVVTPTNPSGNNWEATITAEDGTTTEGTALQFTISFEDQAGNDGATRTDTEDDDGNTVTADFTAPTLSAVAISSNNDNSTLAADNDEVTLSFTASEIIKTPAVTIDSTVVTPTNPSGNNWEATITAEDGTTTEGTALQFTISFEDQAGNDGATRTDTEDDDGNTVTADFTAPTLSAVAILSSNTNSTLAADNDEVTLSFTASEIIKTPAVTIDSTVVTPTNPSGNNWEATITAEDGTTTEGTALQFTISFEDQEGNDGATRTDTEDDDGNTVTADFTAPTLSAVAISSNNDNSTLAADNDEVTLSFTASEIIKTPAVTIDSTVVTPTNPSGNNWEATITAEDGTTTEGTALQFTISFEDQAGNDGATRTDTEDDDGNTVTADFTAPTLSAVAISSNNDNSTLAADNDEVTLSFTASEIIKTPAVTIDSTVVTPTNPSGNNWEATITAEDGTTTEGTALQFTISFEDQAGNDGATRTDTEDDDGNTVTADFTAPTLSAVAILSSNTNTALAADNDEVTLSFTASEIIKTPAVTIDSTVVTPTNPSGNNWEATITAEDGTTTEGTALQFTISFEDQAGNDGATRTDTEDDDGNTVTADFTAPTLSAVAILSSNTNTALAADNDEVTLSFTASEIIKTPAVTIDSTVVTPTNPSGNNWEATITAEDGTTTEGTALQFTISFEDQAGNDGATRTDTEDDDGNTVTADFTAPTLSAVAISSNNDNSTLAADNDEVTLSFTASEIIKTPAVTIDSTVVTPTNPSGNNWEATITAEDGTTTEGTALQFTISFEDQAGNDGATRTDTEDDDGNTVTADFTAPTLSAVAILSSNTNTALAADNDEVTLSFTASEIIKTPAVTIDSTVVTPTNPSGNNWEATITAEDGTTTEGTALQFTISFEDQEGNDGATRTDTEDDDGNTVTADFTAPTLSAVAISSNNDNTALAADNDEVTLSFTASEIIKTPAVTIDSTVVTPTNPSGNNWEATITAEDGTTTEGTALQFTISFEDQAGNDGATRTDTEDDDGNTVTADFTAPTLSAVAISSNNDNSTLAADNDEVTLSFTASEIIKTPAVTIDSTVVTPTNPSGNNWEATITAEDGTTTEGTALQFTISFEDQAGNDGATRTDTEDDDGNTVTADFTAPTLSAVAILSSNTNTALAADNDEVTLSFTASEIIKTPAVTIDSTVVTPTNPSGNNWEATITAEDGTTTEGTALQFTISFEDQAGNDGATRTDTEDDDGNTVTADFTAPTLSAVAILSSNTNTALAADNDEVTLSFTASEIIKTPAVTIDSTVVTPTNPSGNNWEATITAEDGTTTEGTALQFTISFEDQEGNDGATRTDTEDDDGNTVTADFTAPTLSAVAISSNNDNSTLAADNDEVTLSFTASEIIKTPAVTIDSTVVTPTNPSGNNWEATITAEDGTTTEGTALQFTISFEDQAGNDGATRTDTEDDDGNTVTADFTAPTLSAVAILSSNTNTALAADNDEVTLSFTASEIIKTPAVTIDSTVVTPTNPSGNNWEATITAEDGTTTEGTALQFTISFEDQAGNDGATRTDTEDDDGNTVTADFTAPTLSAVAILSSNTNTALAADNDEVTLSFTASEIIKTPAVTIDSTVVTPTNPSGNNWEATITAEDGTTTEGTALQFTISFEDQEGNDGATRTDTEDDDGNTVTADFTAPTLSAVAISSNNDNTALAADNDEVTLSFTASEIIKTPAVTIDSTVVTPTNPSGNNWEATITAEDGTTTEGTALQFTISFEDQAGNDGATRTDTEDDDGNTVTADFTAPTLSAVAILSSNTNTALAADNDEVTLSFTASEIIKTPAVTIDSTVVTPTNPSGNNWEATITAEDGTTTEGTALQFTISFEDQAGNDGATRTDTEDDDGNTVTADFTAPTLSAVAILSSNTNTALAADNDEVTLSFTASEIIKTPAVTIDSTVVTPTNPSGNNWEATITAEDGTTTEGTALQFTISFEDQEGNDGATRTDTEDDDGNTVTADFTAPTLSAVAISSNNDNTALAADNDEVTLSFTASEIIKTPAVTIDSTVVTPTNPSGNNWEATITAEDGTTTEGTALQFTISFEDQAGNDGATRTDTEDDDGNTVTADFTAPTLSAVAILSSNTNTALAADNDEVTLSFTASEIIKTPAVTIDSTVVTPTNPSGNNWEATITAEDGTTTEGTALQFTISFEDQAGNDGATRTDTEDDDGNTVTADFTAPTLSAVAILSSNTNTALAADNDEVTLSFTASEIIKTPAVTIDSTVVTPTNPSGNNWEATITAEDGTTTEGTALQFTISFEDQEGNDGATRTDTEDDDGNTVTADFTAPTLSAVAISSNNDNSTLAADNDEVTLSFTASEIIKTPAVTIDSTVVTPTNPSGNNWEATITAEDGTTTEGTALQFTISFEDQAGNDGATRTDTEDDDGNTVTADFTAPTLSAVAILSSNTNTALAADNDEVTLSFTASEIIKTPAVTIDSTVVTPTNPSGNNWEATITAEDGTTTEGTALQFTISFEDQAGNDGATRTDTEDDDGNTVTADFTAPTLSAVAILSSNTNTALAADNDEVTLSFTASEIIKTPAVTIDSTVVTPTNPSGNNWEATITAEDGTTTEGTALQFTISFEDQEGNDGATRTDTEDDDGNTVTADFTAPTLSAVAISSNNDNTALAADNDEVTLSFTASEIIKTPAVTIDSTVVTPTNPSGNNWEATITAEDGTTTEGTALQFTISFEDQAGNDGATRTDTEDDDGNTVTADFTAPTLSAVAILSSNTNTALAADNDEVTLSFTASEIIKTPAVTIDSTVVTPTNPSGNNWEATITAEDGTTTEGTALQFTISFEDQAGNDGATRTDTEDDDGNTVTADFTAPTLSAVAILSSNTNTALAADNDEVTLSFTASEIIKTPAVTIDSTVVTPTNPSGNNWEATITAEDGTTTEGTALQFTISFEDQEGNDGATRTDTEDDDGNTVTADFTAPTLSAVAILSSNTNTALAADNDEVTLSFTASEIIKTPAVTIDSTVVTPTNPSGNNWEATITAEDGTTTEGTALQFTISFEDQAGNDGATRTDTEDDDGNTVTADFTAPTLSAVAILSSNTNTALAADNDEVTLSFTASEIIKTPAVTIDSTVVTPTNPSGNNWEATITAEDGTTTEGTALQFTISFEDQAGNDGATRTDTEDDDGNTVTADFTAPTLSAVAILSSNTNTALAADNDEVTLSFTASEIIKTPAVTIDSTVVTPTNPSGNNWEATITAEDGTTTEGTALQFTISFEDQEGNDGATRTDTEDDDGNTVTADFTAPTLSAVAILSSNTNTALAADNDEVTLSFTASEIIKTPAVTIDSTVVTPTNPSGNNWEATITAEDGTTTEGTALQFTISFEDQAGNDGATRTDTEDDDGNTVTADFTAPTLSAVAILSSNTNTALAADNDEVTLSFTASEIIKTPAVTIDSTVVTPTNPSGNNWEATITAEDGTTTEGTALQFTISFEDQAGNDGATRTDTEDDDGNTVTADFTAPTLSAVAILSSNTNTALAADNDEVTLSFTASEIIKTPAVTIDSTVVTPTNPSGNNWEATITAEDGTTTEGTALQFTISFEDQEGNDGATRTDTEDDDGNTVTADFTAPTLSAVAILSSNTNTALAADNDEVTLSFTASEIIKTPAVTIDSTVVTPTNPSGNNWEATITAEDGTTTEGTALQFTISFEDQAGNDGATRTDTEDDDGNTVTADFTAPTLSAVAILSSNTNTALAADNDEVTLSFTASEIIKTPAVTIDSTVVTPTNPSGNNWEATITAEDGTTTEGTALQFTISFEDQAGNDGATRTDTEDDDGNTVTADFTAPTLSAVAILSSNTNTALAADNDEVTLSFTASEIIKTPAVTIDSTVVTPTNPSGNNWEATITAEDGTTTEGTALQFTISFEDQEGNDGATRTDTEDDDGNTVTADFTAPTLSAVAILSSNTNTALAADNDEVTLSFTASEIIKTPAVTIDSTVVTPTNPSGNNWEATITAEDGTTTEGTALQFTISFEDQAGNDGATRTDTEDDDGNTVTADFTAPTLSAVAISSNNDNTALAADNDEVTLSFTASEIIKTPAVTIDSTVVTPTNPSGNNWEATITAEDGTTTEGTALQFTISFEDQAGNDGATRTDTEDDDGNTVTADFTAPTLSAVAISSNNDNSTLAADNDEVTLSFTASEIIKTPAVTIDSTVVTPTNPSGNNWEATITAEDGTTTEGTALQFTISFEDQAGNDGATRTDTEDDDGNTVTADFTAPTLSAVAISSNNDNTALAADNDEVTLSFTASEIIKTPAVTIDSTVVTPTNPSGNNWEATITAEDGTTTEGTALQFTISFEDQAGNDGATRTDTEDDDGNTVTADFTAPTLSAVAISSNNDNSTLAADNDEVTLSFTASEIIKTPAVTIDSTVVTPTNPSGNNWEATITAEDGTTTEGTALQFTISFEDQAGNDGATRTDTEDDDGNTVTADFTAPTLSAVAISSNNDNTALAADNDEVTLSFTASEIIKTPAVTIDSTVVTPTNPSGNNWEATITAEDGTTTEGTALQFTISFEDQAGNDGATRTDTEDDDGNTVTADFTAPTLSAVAILSSNTNTALAADNDEVTLSFTASEIIKTPAVTIDSTVVTPTNPSGNNWEATITAEDGTTTEGTALQFTISFEDQAGNDGATRTDTEDDDGNTVTADFTAPTLSAVAISSNNDNSTLAADNDEVTLSFTASEIIKTPAVTIDSTVVTPTNPSGNNWEATITAEDGTTTEGTALQFTISFEDQAGNDGATRTDTEDDDGNTVTADFTAPTLSAVAILSSNTNTALAADNDEVTLSFTASEIIKIPAVTIDSTVVTPTNPSGNNWEATITAEDGTTTEGTALQFTISFEDQAGNDGATRTDTEDDDGNTVTADFTAPTLSAVAISSNNDNSTLAADNDEVTLSFTASEIIKTPAVTIDSTVVTPTNPSGNNWEATITAEDGTTTEGTALQFTISFEDQAGNDGATRTDTEDDDGNTVTADFTAPTLSAVAISSNNDNTALAADNDEVTLSFTASEIIKTPAVTIDSTVVTPTNPSGNNWEATITAEDGTTTEGTALQFTISFEDQAGNDGATRTDTEDDDGNTVTADFTAPTLSAVAISSNNDNSTLAADNDEVTLSFTASEIIKIPAVTIDSTVVTPTNPSGNNWEATITAEDGTTTEGTALQFTISFEDQAGNDGATRTDTEDDDGNTVTADFTAPTLSAVAILSSNTNSTLAADNDEVTLSFTASEIIKTPAVTIDSTVVTPTNPSGNNWEATITAEDGTTTEGTALQFTISFEDQAGNDGATRTDTEDDDGNTVTADFTAPTLSAVAISSNNDNTALAADNDEVTLSFTASEIIKTPAVTIDSTVVTPTNPSGNNWEATITAEDGTTTEGTALQFTISFEDQAGNDGATRTDTEDDDGNTVTADFTAPTLSAVAISSNNDNSTLAADNDEVTLSFTASEIIKTPAVTIDSTVVTPTNPSGNNWEATITAEDGTTTEGTALQFTISFEDQEGNDGATRTDTEDDDGNTVTADFTAPTLSAVAISSNNDNSTLAADNDEVTLSFTASEIIKTPAVTIDSTVVTPTNPSGNNWEATITAEDGTTTEGTALQFTISFEDQAGNDGATRTDTEDDDGNTVTADFTAPTLSAVAISSNNDNTALAADNDEVTLSFTASEIIKTPAVTIDSTVVTPTNPSGNNWEATITAEDGTTTEGTALQFTISFEDQEGNDGATRTDTEDDDGNTVTADFTAPTLSAVAISSNNDNSTLAADNDEVTLSFTASEIIKTPAVTIDSTVVTPTNPSGNNWEATITAEDGTTTEGTALQFTISFEDQAGNDGATRTDTEDDDGNTVTADFTAPTLSAVAISSNNDNTALAADNDEVTLSFTASEIIKTPAVTIDSTVVTPTNPSGNNWEATITAEDGTTTEGTALQFTISFEDQAGNDGATRTDTEDDDGNTVTADFTAPTLSAVAISSNNDNSTLAADNDEVTLSFTASEIIKTPAVTIDSTVVTPTNPSGNNWEATITAEDGTTIEGTALQFTISFEDQAGNDGATRTDTEDDDGNTVTADFTAPTLSAVAISSNNDNSTLAKSGDAVTLFFNASESIQSPTVTIDGKTTTVTGSDTSWNATHTLDGTETQGALSFTISFEDQAGNDGATRTNTEDDDGNTVTADFTVPEPEISTTAADPTNLDPIPFTVTFTESMKQGTFTRADITLSSGTVTNFGTSANQEFAFNITNATEGTLTVDVVAGVAQDLAGNNNTAAGQLSVTVDRTVPTISLNGLSTVTVNLDDSYIDQGATVADNDPNYAGRVIVTENVDTTKVGDYTITYSAPPDAAGNTPTSITRTVTVSDTTAPTTPLETLNAVVSLESFTKVSSSPTSEGTQRAVSPRNDNIPFLSIEISNVDSFDITRVNSAPALAINSFEAEPEDSIIKISNMDIELIDAFDIEPNNIDCPCVIELTYGTLEEGISYEDLVIFHFIGGKWTQLDTKYSPPSTISASIDKFSPFAVGVLTEQEPDRTQKTVSRSGGGGGGGGGGNTGVSVSGDDSKLLDDIKLYSVSWDCVNGLVRIVAGPDASDLHATVRTTAYGLTEATHASDEMLEGRKVFTSSIQPNESYLGVQLIDISGRTLQIRSESITITECIGEKTFDVYRPESTSAIIEEAAAKAREDTITGQRTIFDSPLHQLKIGIPADQVQCNEGLVLVLKPSMEESACVTESTAPKLVLRGWHDVS